MDAFILVAALAVLLAVGVPVAYAVGLSAIVGAFWIDLPLEAVMIQITNGVNKFSLLAIPFFILAGASMRGRRYRPSVADTASIGSVMIPEMEKKGYPRDFAAAVTASGSVQAILTPPSHNSVIYSLATGGTVSIVSLFIAGIMPGLLLSFTIMVMCVGFAHKRGYPKGERVPFKQALKIFVDTLWGLMTVVIIMGGDPLRDLHRHRIRGDCLRMVVLCHHVYLQRLYLGRAAEADVPHRENRHHRDDPDRFCCGLRRYHDLHAVTESHYRLLHLYLG